jgi:diamine N-acetyltransferase
VGIVIADKYRNLGIGQQSLLLLIEYSFNYLGLKQLYAHIDTTNHASRKLFKKCGFEECGLLKSWMRTGRDYRDVVMVQLINS